MRVTMRIFVLLAIMGGATACYDDGGSYALDQPRDEWLVLGRLGNEGFGKVMVLGIDGTTYRSSIKTDGSFTVQLPGNTTYAVHFLPSSKKNGTTPALLSFDDGRNMGQTDTLRLPKPSLQPVLDFGTIDIKDGSAFPTRNPAAELDFDADGIPDFNDIDDQNDRLDDVKQKYQSERVGLCHAEKGNRKFVMVPLANLLGHLEHGDSVGRCSTKAKR